MFKKFNFQKKKYKPYEYWFNRGKKYEENYVDTSDRVAQKTNLLKYLENLSFDSVFEFGCGFGRMTRLMCENFPIKKYYAVDLSPDQIKNARKNCEKYGFIDFHVSTIEDIELDEQFDLVFGTMVLLHVRPHDVKSTIQKLVGFAKKNFVHLDWYPTNKPEEIADHNFIHDYPSIYSEIDGSNEVDIHRIDEKNCIFNLKRN